jgi:transcriptional regulator with XRE-family HTH domain
MVNSADFVYRVNKIMDYYQLSPSAFADKIKVQRSSISHLLSGRNKPSLDFVLKVVKEFDSVDLYWLLNGKGTFPNKIHSSPIPEPLKNKDPIQTMEQVVNDTIESQSTFKKIEKVLLFYSDGTFKEYVQ